MADLSTAVLQIKGIMAASDLIAKRLGADWPAFEALLRHVLLQLVDTEEENLRRLVDELMMSGLHAPKAKDIFREIGRQSRAAKVMDGTRSLRSERLSISINVSTDAIDGAQQLRQASSELLNELAQRGRQPVSVEEDVASPVPGEPVPSERRINAWIEERSDGQQPLRREETYTLCFKIGGPIALSLLTGDATAVPASDVPEGGLETHWVLTTTTVELAAHPQGPTVEVGHSHGAWTAKFTLHIPQQGESHVSMLRITPRIGPARLEVYIYARQELYRQFTLILTVEEEYPTGIAIIQDDVCHAPAAHLNLRTMHEWTTPPGELTVFLSDSGYAQVYGDVAGESVGSATPWQISVPTISGRMQLVRAAAERLRMQHEVYLNDVDPATLPDVLQYTAQYHEWPYDWNALPDYSEQAHRQAWERVSVSPELRDLAVYGRRLYEAFFPEGSQLRGWLEQLQPGHRLNLIWQNAPVSDVPCGLMYVSPVPEPDQPVDPIGFLAFRLRLEYKPYRAQGGSKSLGDPQHTGRTMFLFWGDHPSDPTAIEAQWQRQQWSVWQNNRILPTAPATGRQELLEFFRAARTQPVPVLYMYCQCSVGDGTMPVLRFGNTNGPMDIIRGTDLTHDLPNRPLVFVNACTTSASDPYKVNELEAYFCEKNSRGYLGTESKVPIQFASRFAWVFFQFLYRIVDPAPMAAGEAVSQTRLFFWTHYRNIGGLFYTYLNQYELFMAEDAEVKSMRL